MYDLIARVGELTGRRDAVGPLTDTIRRRIEVVRASVRALPTPRVLYVLWPDPLLVPGRDSHLTELIELAGGQSITAAEPVSYVRFSIEAAVARAPDVIVLADHSSGASTAGRASPEKWQALTSVPAIRAGRLYSADLSILHRYGPRVPEGLEMLARMIHPEAFK
jgi:iron complex transport system substrate-binding protein